MIPLSRAALLILLVVALAAPAGAEHCAWRTTISEPEFQQWGYYIDNDLCQPECVVGLWVYQESNGIPGLQRQDAVQDDTCGGEIPGDTLLLGGLPLATDAV